jgi:hypothetical protein
MFGREVAQPIDLTFGILTANRKDKDIVEYVKHLIIALNLTHNEKIGRHHREDRKENMILGLNKSHIV